MRSLIVTSAVTVLGLGTATLTLAQNAADESSGAESASLEEIVVTAERREENLQKTALSITALTAEDLQAHDDTAIDSALRDVAGVVIQGNANGAYVFIRGVGASQDTAIGGPAVNLNFDGVYQQQTEIPLSSMYDVERVEVLRGPQGTLYGRNATAGSINIITADPTDKTEASGSVGFGNYSLIKTEGMVNVPVSSTLAVRAAMLSERHDGYLQPSGYDDEDNLGGRLKVLYKPNSDVRLLLAGDYLHIGGVGNGGVTSLATHPDDPWYSTAATGKTDLTSWRVYGQLDWNLGFGTLTVLPAHQHFFKFDNNVIIVPATTSSAGEVEERQDTAEVRLASSAGSKLTWVAGVYYLDSHTTLPGGVASQIALPAGPFTFPYLSGNKVSSKAGFAQATFPVTSALRLTGGARYNKDDKTAFDETSATATVPYSGSWSSFTYKAGVELDVAPQSLLYANVSTGFKAGGLDQGFNKYNPEKLRSYSVGSKNRFFDNRFQLNAEAFYYDYKDFQAQYGYRCQNSAACPTITGFANTIVNAGTATLYGIDLETSTQLTSVDRIDLNYSYLHSVFDQLVIVPGTANNAPAGCAATLSCNVLPNQILTNQPLSNAPRNSGSLSYEHRFVLADSSYISLSGDVHYYSSYWTLYRRPPQVPAESLQDDYSKYNAFLGYNAADDRWSLRGYVKNLANKAIVTSAVGPALTLQSPRTYGVTFTARL